MYVGAIKKDPKYIESLVMTASPGELIVITYEALLDALNSAVNALNNNEVEEFGDKINFSKRAVRELTIALDMSQEISESLIAIYFYVQKLLSKAQIKKDVTKVQQAIKVLNPLYDGFKEIIQSSELEDQNSNVIQKKANIVAGMTYGKDDISVVTNMSSGYKV
jgi:flagellar protein FliS